MIKNSTLIETFKKNKMQAEAGLRYQVQQAKDNHSVYAGNDRIQFNGPTKTEYDHIVNFNRARPIVNAAAGFAIQMRQRPEYLAKITDNEVQRQYSEFLNLFYTQIREDANFDQVESRQDLEMFITGYGATDTSLFFQMNPDGEVKKEALMYDEVLWDPHAHAKNLLDARYVFRKKRLPLNEALKIFKGSKPEDFTPDSDVPEGQVVLVTGNTTIRESTTIENSQGSIVSVYSYQWYELQNYYRSTNPILSIQDPNLVQILLDGLRRVIDLRKSLTTEEDKVEDIFTFDPTADILVMSEAVKNDVAAFFERFDVEFDPIEEQRRVYYTAIMSSDKVFDKFKSPDQNGFTIKFKTGDYDINKNRWLGIIDAVKEANLFANKSITQMLRILSLNAKGGLIYEEDAIDDPRLLEEYAKPNSNLAVNPGALAGGKIQPKGQPHFDSGYESILAIAQGSLPTLAGFNAEALANATNGQVSGILEQQRINQVITNLAPYFDSILLYQKEQASLMITYMRMLAENNPNRLIRTTGNSNAQQFALLMEDQFAQEYMITIGEAPDSATMKSEKVETLLTLAQQLSAQGINIYPVALKYLNLPEADIAQLLQLLNPSPPQATDEQMQLQQLQQQLLIQQQQANIANDMASVRLKEAQVTEKQMNNQSTMVDIEKTIAETEKIEAETEKTEVETNQKELENMALASQPIDRMGVII